MDHGREDKNPWTKWYWQDWESDIGLQLCSLSAQGLWMQMLSIMSRSNNKGFLLDGKKQMESKTLAKKARTTTEIVEPLLEELFEHGVPSKTIDGIIYNRRMARESELSKIRSEAGKLGGRPKSKIKAKQVEVVKAVSASASAYASIFFNYSSLKWEGIKEDDIDTWKKAYPGCDITRELSKMTAWLMGDWPARKKVRWKAFVVRWLSNAQDRGGTRDKQESTEDYLRRQQKELHRGERHD